jgi:ABC-type branched-subunit amino acid transport system substrate-binding protein
MRSGQLFEPTPAPVSRPAPGPAPSPGPAPRTARAAASWPRVTPRLSSARLLSAAAVTALLALAACGGSSSTAASSGSTRTSSGTGTGTINVAVIGPMTGPAAEIGNLMSGACYAAVLDVNKAGGVLGRKVSCALVDDTGDPADAVPDVTRALATTSNLNMAVGLESNTAATTIPLVNNAHIPMVSTNGLVAYDKTRDAYFWRMTPSDDQNGAAFAAWAARKGYKRVAVVFQNNIGAQGNEPGVAAGIKKIDGTMTTNITIPGDASSYSSVVARVLAGKPQALILAGDPQTSATFLSEYRTLSGGHVPPVITSTDSITPAYFSAVKKVMGGGYMIRSMAFVGSYVSPGSSAFSIYKSAVYGASQIKDPATILGVGVIASIYDGINLMGLAMQKAHSTSGPAYNTDIARIAAGAPGAVVVDSYAAGLAALKAGQQIHYVGVGGPIHFNAFHNSPGNFSASGFTASGSPTLLAVIPGTQVQQLLTG